MPNAEAAFLSEEHLFDALATSGFEFLERAIDEFSTSAKFSTIYFATAIELFLKAKLMREHWSLILDKPDQADKAAFFRGDAKTVTPDQAVDRLKRIASVNINQAYRDTFDKIAKHRNKMVHFVHAGTSEDVDPTVQHAIAEEQCGGWLALRTLLSEWQEFQPYGTKIWQISAKMEGHKTYLKKAFQAKRAELKAHTEAGGRVINCPSCSFKSVKVDEPDGAVAAANCLVCRYFHGSEITVPCSDEDCSNEIRFTSYDGPPETCPKCKTSISKEEIAEFLDTGETLSKDNYLDHVDINCPECSGYHSVVPHHDIYICTECYHTDTVMEVCGWCSDGQIGGVPEYSSISGCDFCDGSAGWNRDD